MMPYKNKKHRLAGFNSLVVLCGLFLLIGLLFASSIFAAPPDSIGNFVWYDLDADGIQDAGEPGIGGVTVNLYDPGADLNPGGGDDVLLNSTATQPTGFYEFAGLSTPTDYFIEFVAPTGLTFSAQDQGGDDSVDSDADTVTGQTAAFTLSAGEGKDDVDAGLHPPTTIGDFVWNDLDADGIQDVGEPGIGSVTVNLFTSGDVPAGTTTTAFDGSYSFSSIVDGDYYVQFVAPAGFTFSPQDQGVDNIDSDADTGTGKTAVFSVAAGTTKDDVDAGLFQAATIGNLAWDDINGNGVQDGGETGIIGVTVRLFDTTDTEIVNMLTNASGYYTFTNLIPNTYYLQFSTPAGNLITPKDQGGDDQLDSDIDTTTGKTANFGVAFGEVQSDMDAGFYLPGTIGDFIWNDLNGDGVQDGGEPGFTGVTVDLIDDINGNGVIDGGEPVLTTKTTDGSGAFDFTGLPARDYIVDVTDTGAVLTGYALTGGTDPLPVTITAGQDFNSADFGYQQQDAQIGDFVWNDLNGDGVQDVGEPGITGVTLDLIDDANGNGVIDGGESVLATQTTNGSGAFNFTGLAAGNTIVNVTDTGAVLTGFVLTGGTNPFAVTITAGQVDNSADFGYQQQNASIGDFIWNDLDGDGVQDGGEPGLAGVTVDLINDANSNGAIDGGEPVLATQTTNGSGGFDFFGLIAGNYIVDVTDTGAVLTNFGLTGGTDPLPVTVTAGQDYNDADFGYQQQNGTIGDFVWNDLNGDGMQDGGEPGLAGVTVDLIDDANGNGAIDGGESVLATQTTNGSGGFDFTGLVAGDYLVNVTDTSGMLTGFGLTGGTNPLAVSITAGQNYDGADFGYQEQDATIGDFVWNDLNGDGVQDGGEPGIAGVTVDLIDDANGNGVIDGGESVLVTQTTNGSGGFDFTGLIGGTYIVDVTDTGAVLTNFGLTGGTDPLAITLTAGQDYNGADFGYQQQNASIGDYIWGDLNGDGVQDGGEVGIVGVTADLIDDANGNGVIDGGESILATQITNGSGGFDFTGLAAGDYLVNVTDTGGVLTGFGLTGGTNPLPVTITAGQDDNGADFGYQQQDATIGDFVWNDLNGDSIQDGGEPGIAGVTLDLIDDANGNGVIDGGETVLSTQTTTGSGGFDFTGLAVGDYIVNVTDTGGVLTGFNLTGGTDPTAVSITAGQDYNGADFGYQDSATASIGDFIWNDLNGDGVQDGGELGIDGVTIDLIDDANGNGVIDGGESVLTTQTTGGGGAYDFTGLVGDDYIVDVTDTGAVLTIYGLTGGTDPLAVTISAGQDDNSADFGYRQQNASIGDFIWNDVDGDGVQDGGELGIDGVTVDLVDDANGNGVINGGESVLATLTTATGGAYDFTSLPAGDYVVNVTDTGGMLSAFGLTGGTDPLAVTITAGQDYNDADFGYQQQNASIGDLVWQDLNGNGVKDGGEPVFGGVTVDLIDDANGNGIIDGGEAVLATQTTSGSGGFDFTALPFGDYIVDVTDTGGVLAGFVLTGGTDPTAVSITAGQNYNDADFGYQDSYAASIGDFIWNDLNGDGIQDGGEPGFAGVTVDLIDDANGNGVIDGGESVLATQTTNGSGGYDFTGLAGDDYIVDVTDTGGVLTFFMLTGGTDPLAVTISAAQDYNGADFGFKDPAIGAIGNFMWNDRDGDGTQEDGEPGLDAVTVNLTGAGPDDTFGTGDDVTYPAQVTGSSGAYDFFSLTAGKYVVDVDESGLPAGLTLTGGTEPLTVTLAVGEDYNDADFGYQGNASISGNIWLDDDGNGSQDIGEGGVSGIIVYLDLDGDNNRDLEDPYDATDGSGGYAITGLHAGSYNVKIDSSTVPAGYILNTTMITSVTLAAGEAFTGADFGYVEGFETFIPLVLNNFISAPDLVVTQIDAGSDLIQVVVENQGNAATVSGFWVDFYVDPDPVPTHENQTWSDVSSQGLVWGVTVGLLPGEVLTLTYSTDPAAPNLYYSEADSAYSGVLVPGTSVYAQVDSVHLGTSYGGILETHEINGEPYNNITGSTATAVSSFMGMYTAVAIDLPKQESLLPPRR